MGLVCIQWTPDRLCYSMRLIFDLYHFTRFSAFGATAVLPLLGAGLAQRTLSFPQVARLLGVAAAFHTFAYVDNDLCDLKLDRGQPLRTHYPLVRGAIRPATARAISLGALATTFLIDHLATARAPRQSSAICRLSSVVRRPRFALAAACALLALYNRYGKRCPLPPLTDALQGVGWAALIAYGADGRINRSVALLMLHELLLILLVNGVHGPLRDLANDAEAGARTTALWLGAQVNAGGSLQIAPALLAYALALQGGMIVGLAATLQAATATQTLAQQRAAYAGVGGCVLLTVALLGVAARNRAPANVAGMLHLILILSAPLALVAPALSGQARGALLLVHILPLLTNGLTYDALRWLYAQWIKGTAGEPWS